MIKNIIALKGKGSCGKTTSIGYLHEELLSKYTLIETTFSKVGSDFISVFEINEVMVGISSKGDTYDDVMGDLKKLISKGCEFLICACRTYDRKNSQGEIRGSNTAIDSLTDFEPIRLDKTKTNIQTNRESCNKKDADRLLQEINNRLF